MNWRFLSLIIIFGGLYSFLIFNIYNLQLEKGYYFSTVGAQRLVSRNIESIRGKIYFTDKNNNLILAALNRKYVAIYAVPVETQGNYNESDLKALSQIINMPIKELTRRLNKQDDLYELLIQRASAEQVKEVKKLEIKGIYFKNQILRFYPFGNLASHVLGFIGPTAYSDKLVGRYGVEFYFDRLLAGEPGVASGQNLVLTIDRAIQAQAEKILNELIQRHSAVGGTVIVQEPSTGKILAMGNFPNFNPNEYALSETGIFLNPAVQAVYEPGSVFKLFTMAAGFSSGKITPETTYYDSGSVELNNRIIRNWGLRAHGIQTMANVIENSINTGTVFAVQKIGHNIFYNYLIKFGLNELTNFALPGEVRGSFRNLKNGRAINFATASFGHGISVTPISLINAISAIANDGILMRPCILSGKPPETIRRVISSDAAEVITQIMASSVRKNIIADIPNFSIAGKTGTAHVPDFEKGGYTDEVINTFVGFAPASDPQFTILIKLDKPAGAPLAGSTVVPAFRELARFILNYYNIAPDKL